MSGLIERKKNNGNIKKVESLVIFKCNCRCVMCSTGLQIDRSIGCSDYEAIRPGESIMNDIDEAVNIGAAAFAFSGGEATLRADLSELVRYAKSSGIDHIEVQSNGRIYANLEYCKKLIEAGVNNFVVSYHVNDEELNDMIMGVPGAYKQTRVGIWNLNDLGFKVKINIVLMKYNYEFLECHVREMLQEFDISEIRFTFVMIEGNVLENIEGIVPKLKEVGEHVCRAIEIAKDEVECFVYNMVPCVLTGYEKYINDLGNYDTLLFGPDFETSLDDTRKDKKIKSDKCCACKYNEVCGGVWKNYGEVMGLDELCPVLE